ncbi:hypothetical protein RJZ56_006900 [Blastomyces dermatitidis]|uniref:Uncharacterized protein n=3 Tax=Blastomyces TaxID=229219 RepID=A0A179U9T0_BLAGS|nr:uncharacterized protein BDBG_01219 [Blastomyces gilchristii SLH14081]XP_045276095.1 uncharacterized protein BDCG_04226 [Blastomyces dermatitidis ER-3]EGE81572.1 hypothetical protein BDDG_04515 [Blastomyces dermatitidis ATCC 18188]EQL31735.1 hypothetical protein BDFG_05965 [Blastomyces dermatitidis ATCC 26199]EEQ89106.1 hypothetical protein BDCG_04226 [Blastomyces dermatitidis ER-3]OAT04714.1 hypothetical protein BDBG_01219 [Blastomyces gilchristii SLH14081]
MEVSMLIIGGTLMAVTLVYLALNKEQRNCLIGDIKIGGRRASSAAILPCSISPEKQVSAGYPYGDTLPPSRRHVLSEMNDVPLPLLDEMSPIVFNFKALFTPVTDFRDEPCVPKLIVKILKEGKRPLLEYKNTWHVEHVVLPALEKWAAEKEEKGLVESGWKVTTLDESPWFKRWEEK